MKPVLTDINLLVVQLNTSALECTATDIAQIMDLNPI